MGYALKYTYTCLWCGHEAPAVQPNKRFCTPECGVKYRSVNGSRLEPSAYPEPADVVKRLTKAQEAERKRRAHKRDIAAMTYRVGGHTDAEYEQMRADLATRYARLPPAWEWPAGRKVVE